MYSQWATSQPDVPLQHLLRFSAQQVNLHSGQERGSPSESQMTIALSCLHTEEYRKERRLLEGSTWREAKLK
jgi:hypothetical protein